MLLKNSLRQLMRNKLFSILNILGLTIGISACWVIYKYVSYELSFEKDLPEKEQVYRLLSHFKADGRDELFSGVSRPVYSFLKENPMGLDEVVAHYRFFYQSVTIPEVAGQEKRYEEPKAGETVIIETDKDYFDLINYKWLAGNPQTALNEPHQVVLTASRAKHYFPKLSEQDILGKTIIYNDSIKKVISGIVANLSYPSEFNGQEFILITERDRDKTLMAWSSTNGADNIYLKAKDEQTLKHALAQTQKELDAKWQAIKKQELVSFDFIRTLESMPIQESHFSTHMKETAVAKTSYKVIYSLIGVALFLLILACINYINLTTAQMPQRYKEIGIRKTLGGSKRSLVLQMMTETAMMVLVAGFFSIFVSRLGVFLLGDLVSANTKNYQDIGLFIGVMGIILLSSIIVAGLYPAWIMSRVNAVDIFRNKGQVQVGSEKMNLRKAMIVFQFIIAQIFIVGAIVIGQQLKYVVHTDLGFNKENVAVIQIPYKTFMTPNFQSKKMALYEEIKKIPGVEKATMGEMPLNNSFSSNQLQYIPNDQQEPISKNIFFKTIDPDYLDFYDMKLLAGTALIPSDTTNGYIINETAVKAFGFKNPQEAIGKFIGQSDDMQQIVAVVKDFYAQNFYKPIDPMALSYENRNLQNYSIRLNPAKHKEWPVILDQVHHTWNKFFSADQFSARYYDENILEMYKKEQQLFKLSNISTGIAILISCLGLFGLATLTAFQRSKEIGIRKVLGASVSGIVRMLSKDFIIMILLAILIASPIIWWLCSKWLDDFVYRIEITWIPFVLGGLIAILAALLTISYQAIKAAKANPVDSLRDE